MEVNYKSYYSFLSSKWSPDLNYSIIPLEDLIYVTDILKIKKLEKVSNEKLKSYHINLVKLLEKYNYYSEAENFEIQAHSTYKSFSILIDYLIRAVYETGALHTYTWEDIQRVKNSASMLAVSLTYCTLPEYAYIVKRNGFYRLCNYHNEKTPSFVVYEDSSSFCCYGCKASGSAINFLMEMEELSFKESLVTLAFAYGISLPKNNKIKPREDIAMKIRAMHSNPIYINLIHERLMGIYVRSVENEFFSQEWERNHKEKKLEFKPLSFEDEYAELPF